MAGVGQGNPSHDVLHQPQTGKEPLACSSPAEDSPLHWAHPSLATSTLEHCSMDWRMGLFVTQLQNPALPPPISDAAQPTLQHLLYDAYMVEAVHRSLSLLHMGWHRGRESLLPFCGLRGYGKQLFPLMLHKPDSAVCSKRGLGGGNLLSLSNQRASKLP